MSSEYGGVDLEALRDFVVESVGGEVIAIDLLSRDEFCRTFIVGLSESLSIVARVAWPHIPATVLETEMATLKYIRERTTIPVPGVIAFELCHNKLGTCLLMEKAPGVLLRSIYPNLDLAQKSSITTQLAGFMVQLSEHRFDALGSLVIDPDGDFAVGSVVRPRFYLDGRARLDLDRGPFPSVKEYFLACAQRELDCARILTVQEASENYRQGVEEGRLQVERSMGLMIDLVEHSQNLDAEGDALSAFTLSFPELDDKHICVDQSDPSKIVSILGWTCITTHALWHCARVPRLFESSLAHEEDLEKNELTAVFKRAVLDAQGADSVLARALDTEDARQALNDVCEYDAFTDGFLLTPTLESIKATLPGHEDVAGLSHLLDPATLPGRVARISLLTHGSNAMYLAASPPRKPQKVSKPYQGERQRVLSMHNG